MMRWLAPHHVQAIASALGCMHNGTGRTRRPPYAPKLAGRHTHSLVLACRLQPCSML